ncbi:MAG: efflux RND transporter periplasmic adaptor subunit [Planctomycetota bacterium]
MNLLSFVRRFRGWRPSAKWFFFPPSLLGIGVVVVLASAKKELPRSDGEQAALPIQVAQVYRSDAYPKIVGYGTARAVRTWTATAEVGGQVELIHPDLRSGNAVRKGEVLLKIDPLDYQMRAEQRRSELIQAQSQLDQMRLALEADTASLEIQQRLLTVRKRDVERLESLKSSLASSESERDATIATMLQQAQTVQNLESSLATYPAQIQSAEASVAAAESRLREAERSVARTTIVAPFDGVLSSVTLERKQYVAPNQQLFQLVDLSAVEIEAQFSLSQLGRVLRRSGSTGSTELQNEFRSTPPSFEQRPKSPSRNLSPQRETLVNGLSASVAVRSGDVTFEHTACVVRLSEAVDEQTRTLGIVIRVENSSAIDPILALRPGSYCEIILGADAPTEAFVVPRTSLEADSVYVVGEDSCLEKRPVHVVFPLRDQVAIDTGLEDGDLLVLSPPSSARDGDPVAPYVVPLTDPEANPPRDPQKRSQATLAAIRKLDMRKPDIRKLNETLNVATVPSRSKFGGDQ